MLRLAAHTYSFRDLGLDKALDKIVALGFSEVELWAGHVADGARARRACDLRALVPVAYSIGSWSRIDRERLGRLGTEARELGVERVVVCPAAGLLPEIWKCLSPGLPIAAENHWDHSLSGPARVVRELDATAGAGACLDTGHALCAGWAPERFAERLGSRLEHVHLKEARRAAPWQRALGTRLRRRSRGRQPTWPGEGDLSIRTLLAQLERRHYTGVVTLEYEGPQPEQALDRLLRMVL